MQEELFHGSLPRLMGTTLEFITIGTPETPAGPLWEKICTEGRNLEKILNRFDPLSETSRLNRGEKFRPGGTLTEVLEAALGYKELTAGLFDIRPDGSRLDFGGFAKGWFLQWISGELDRADVRNAFVNFGGSSILARGAQPGGDCWKVGIVNPWGGAAVSEAELRNEALSTSGNSPGYSGHILNPLTGQSCERRRVCTVTSRSAVDAEVLSTALMIADERQAEAIRKNFPEAKCKIFDLE